MRQGGQVWEHAIMLAALNNYMLMC